MSCTHCCPPVRPAVPAIVPQRARIGFEGLGQLHGSSDGVVAMRGDLGVFKGGRHGSARRQLIQASL